MSRHLCECPACSRAYRAIAPAPVLPQIASEVAGESLHLSYEQISAGLDAAPESQAWVTVEQHILVCESCAQEVAELRTFDSKLAEANQVRAIAIPPAKAQSPTVLDMLRNFFRAPQSPAFAGVSLSLLAVGFFLVLANPAAAESSASIGTHSDFFQVHLAPRSIAGAILLLTGAGGLIFRFLRNTTKD